VSLVACLIGCGRSGSGTGSEVFGPSQFIDSDLAGLSILFNTEGVLYLFCVLLINRKRLVTGSNRINANA
jgi:hypothetical protein